MFWLPDAKSWFIRKDPDAGKHWRQEKGMTDDAMIGSHHWLNEHEFEQAPEDGEGQGSLVCCSPWGHKESDKTEKLNNYHSKPHSRGLQPTRLLWPWDSPARNTRVGSHPLLQGIFPTQNQTWVSPITGRFFTIWATRETQTFSTVVNHISQRLSSPPQTHPESP